jgi:hypothetical protein
VTGRGLRTGDRVVLVRPAVDAHSLGPSRIADLLKDCGVAVVQAPPEIADALERPEEAAAARAFGAWMRGAGITALGFSYRLDPEDGRRRFAALAAALERLGLARTDGCQIRNLYFAGLPAACALVEASVPGVAATFGGSESPAETLGRLGLDLRRLPPELAEGARYDDDRMAFGRELVSRGDWAGVGPVDRSSSRAFGLRGDSLVARIDHGAARGLPPLLRAHVGPYLPDRREAVALFLDWTRRLASGGLLDVLSIGNSQLSQSAFGEDWRGRADGGGVPIATDAEFAAVWRAARPMLVRCYAGSRGVEATARRLERSLDMAWHAFSLWWFSELDGRGPNSVAANLREHAAALRYVASVDKPFEPNVPHHFAFRGGDDVTYVLSGLVAAKAAKAAGVRNLVLQIMLNTPRGLTGLADLARSRALLHLVRELEGGDFRVFLQPRAGLDYLAPDPEEAKAQLAAATALMDDIEPADPASPPLIHVVSYSEGYALADPPVVEDSLRIVRRALDEYRRLRADGGIDDRSADPYVLGRTAELIREVRTLQAAAEAAIPHPYSAAGLYGWLAAGYFAAPDLVAGREEFAAAAAWRTRLVRGAVRVVDAYGAPIGAAERAAAASAAAERHRREGAV